MLVLLPPSETKAAGGDGPPLELEALSFPELNPARDKLIDALVELSSDVPASLSALGISQRQADEVRRNAELRHAPTVPALHRYTGVLYDALDVDGLSAAERSRAYRRLAVASALFGLVRGADPIPAYRLSGGNALPSVGTLRGFWRPALEPVLAAVDELVVDLRSGPYAALARVAGAITVRVVNEDAHGRRKTVSHHNKAHKGQLARTLARAGREPSDVPELVELAAGDGLHVERVTEHQLELVIR
ncbi:MAG: peroxide stress protein YaaA [Pseudonocardiaceae bacterium]|nr:peroxide stress protein YaaA [Pseudonocardiaceae bacterium]